METKFTEGPWSTKGEYGVIYAPRRVDRPLNQPDRIIAECNQVIGGVAIVTKEFAANAHLVAAAPEMYKALNATLDKLYAIVEQYGDRSCYYDVYEAVHTARTALAHARGEK